MTENNRHAGDLPVCSHCRQQPSSYARMSYSTDQIRPLLMNENVVYMPIICTQGIV